MRISAKNISLQKVSHEGHPGCSAIERERFYPFWNGTNITGCAWENTRSSRIANEFKGPSPHTHQALDDAIEQAEMFRRMRAKIAGKSNTGDLIAEPAQGPASYLVQLCGNVSIASQPTTIDIIVSHF
jgi:hypothetical protein